MARRPTRPASSLYVTGAAWGTNSVQITGIVSNFFTINNGPRAGQQGIAFTLELTPNENIVLPTFMFKRNIFSVTLTRATVSGSRNTTTSAGRGTVTLVSPMRILTGLGFLLPGVAKQVLTFVPEPGTLILLSSAAIGLALAGRNRLRK